MVINLTNEKIRKKFTSQFELVNYAIRLAENMIKSGRDPRVKIDTQNRSLQVLAEIAVGKDQFDELLPTPSVEIEEYIPKDRTSEFRHFKDVAASSRSSKKSRKEFSESV